MSMPEGQCPHSDMHFNVHHQDLPEDLGGSAARAWYPDSVADHFIKDS